MKIICESNEEEMKKMIMSNERKWNDINNEMKIVMIMKKENDINNMKEK